MAATLSIETPQVLTEIRSSGGLKLSAVGKTFPAARGPGRVNPATVWRWAREGVRTPNGRIKLEVVKVGMSWLTSQSAVDRFVIAITSAADPTPQTPPRSAAARNRASEAAGRRLEAMGA